MANKYENSKERVFHAEDVAVENIPFRCFSQSIKIKFVHGKFQVIFSFPSAGHRITGNEDQKARQGGGDKGKF
jgi:hypothetical protein